MSKLTGFVVTVFLLLAAGPAVHADDTELFSSASTSARAKVLVIFDHSGSMDKRIKEDGNRTRLAIAQEVVKNLINTNQDVDFGMMVFNSNKKGDEGGRVVQRIIPNMNNETIS